MKKSIVFIGIIFLFLLIPTTLLATAEEVVVRATIENNEIYVGNKTKVGFTATFTDPKNPSLYVTFDENNFSDNGILRFDNDCFTVSYSTDNSNIAAVDDKGIVTGISAGTATITEAIKFNLGNPQLSKTLLKYTNSRFDSSSCAGVSAAGAAVDHSFTYMPLVEKHSKDTFIRRVTIKVLPGNNFYLCQPGSKPVPVQIAVNAASTETDRICVGTTADVGYSVTLSGYKDPTVKYSLNKYDHELLNPFSFAASYSSDNSSIAAVDDNGRVTGVSEGWATITVELKFAVYKYDYILPQINSLTKAVLAVDSPDLAKNATLVTFTRHVSILVNSAPIMSDLILTQSESRELAVASPLGYDFDRYGDFLSLDPSIASVKRLPNLTYKITALKPGKTNVAYYKIYDNYENAPNILMMSSVTVYPVMTINPEILTVYQDMSDTLKVSFDSWYSGEKSGTWSIADDTIASIDQNGKVTGKKAGTTVATFTVTATGIQADCTVTVKPLSTVDRKSVV